jgi:hypothetical protein
MIKFFRKIRQKMLTENKFSKYLLYAIGEIFLVVIGILIALQINNKNQLSQKNHAINQGLLEVKDNLINDSLQMTRTIQRIREEKKIQQDILNLLGEDKLLDSTYNSQLGKCMAISTIKIGQNGYKTLQAIGLKNLNNQYLEKQLIQYYDVLQKSYDDEIGFSKGELVDVWLPYVRKNFKDYNYRNYAVPKSYKSLSSDSEFLVMLKINQDKKKGTIAQLTDMQITLREILKIIKAYRGE